MNLEYIFSCEIKSLFFFFKVQCVLIGSVQNPVVAIWDISSFDIRTIRPQQLNCCPLVV